MPTTQLQEIDNPDNELADDVDWEERVTSILGEQALATVWDERHRADEASWRQIPGEQIDAALESAEIIKDNLRVAVRVTKEVACKLLGEGKFLTAHHSGQRTGTEKGDSHALSTYLAHRDRKEREIGFAPKEGEPKIIYGYLEDITTQEYKDRARPYGQVSFVLKPEVIQRTTFTHGDSLQSSIMHAARLIGFDKAAKQFELDNTSNTLKGRRRNYIEAQVQGGLTLDDIESITYRADQWEKESIVEFLASVEAAGDTEHLDEVNPKTGRHTRLGWAKLWVGIKRAGSEDVEWFVPRANVPPQGVIAGGPDLEHSLIGEGDKLVIQSRDDTSYLMGWRLAYEQPEGATPTHRAA